MNTEKVLEEVKKLRDLAFVLKQKSEDADNDADRLLKENFGIASGQILTPELLIEATLRTVQKMNKK